MTVQIAVRLPDEQVDFIDRMIARGGVRSRAELVSRAVASLQRRDQAVQDLEKIRAQPYEEFEDFHRWALAALDDA